MMGIRISPKIVVLARSCEVATPLNRAWRKDAWPGVLRQLVVALAEALEAHRETDAFFGRLEDDESRGLAVAQLLDQVIVHNNFGHAPIGQTTDEASASDVGLVDLEPEAGGKQYADGRNHAHEAALLIGGLEHEYGKADIGAIFGSDALNERALLPLGAGRRVAADLPVIVDRLDGALRRCALGRARQGCQYHNRQGEK